MRRAARLHGDSSAQFLLLQGKEFDLDLKNSSPLLQPLFTACRRQLRILLRQAIVWPKIFTRTQLGTDEDIDEAMRFTIDHSNEISERPQLHQLLDRLPHWVWRKIATYLLFRP